MLISQDFVVCEDQPSTLAARTERLTGLRLAARMFMLISQDFVVCEAQPSTLAARTERLTGLSLATQVFELLLRELCSVYSGIYLIA